MDDCVAGFLEIVNFVFVGRLNVGTDEHQFFDGKVVESLGDCLRRSEGGTASGLFDDFNDRGFVR